MNSICLDGKIFPADQPALMVNNRSYRYGDGLFETIKMKNGKILLEDYHFERLFSGLATLEFELPFSLTKEKLKAQILHLCQTNNCEPLAGVRLSVFRGNGGLNDKENVLQYVIECWPLDASVEQLNKNGFVIDIYPVARKSCDQFSNLKSANYMPYTMAAHYARMNGLDDSLVLNMHDRIADASVANIFLINKQKLITPVMKEGCVNGTMRRWLVERYNAEEAQIKVEDLLSADELFLTNALYGVRWINKFRDKTYTNQKTSAIHEELHKEIWI